MLKRKRTGTTRSPRRKKSPTGFPSYIPDAKEDRNKFYRAVEQSANIVIITDLTGVIEYVNPRFSEVTGYDAKEVLGKNPRLLKSGETPLEQYKKIWETILSGKEWRGLFHNKRKNGKFYWAQTTISPIKDNKGRITHFLAIQEDITRRRETEEVLRKSEKKYRDLFESSRDAIMTLEPPSWIFTSGNPATVRMFRAKDEADFVSYGPWQLSPERQPDGQPSGEKAREMIETAMRKGSHFFEWMHRRIGGEDFFANVLLTRTEREGKAMLQATVRDISEQKRAEEALKMFRTLVDGANDAIEVLDPETGRFLDVNERGCLDLGYNREEYLALSVFDIDPMVDPSSFAKVGEELRKSGSLVWEGTHRRKDGSTFPVEVNLKLVRLNRDYMVAVVRDITKRKQAEVERAKIEEQLRQSQKMESIGRLTGGVAHDFNNLLGIIIGNCELALNETKPDGPVGEYLKDIKEAGDRATVLTRQLLAFSRKQVLQPAVLNLNDTLEEADRLLQRLIGENIQLLTVPAPDLGLTKADPSQIEQIILNLATNARDAMPHGGKLILETKNATLDEGYTSRHPEAQPGAYVMLAVSDTGTGMDEKTLARLFEPFFTTKGKGKGTGLGLSMVYGIVKQSGGHISAYSEPGKGTSFKIYLPWVEGDEKKSASPAKSPPASLAGSEKVMVVEDEEKFRKFICRVLRKKGYTVLEAPSGEEALRMSGSHQNPIAILVTDVILRGMSGRETAERMTSKRPDMKVLYISGYTDNAIVHHGVLEEGTNFLQKPFTSEDLARKVREVLGAC
ncbi:MAG: PAS domain S-box protein [Deltaproteobacteria bacterium]|nr:PAS domain S-box protein [Deltaproteobacteria bacterium]